MSAAAADAVSLGEDETTVGRGPTQAAVTDFGAVNYRDFMPEEGLEPPTRGL